MRISYSELVEPSGPYSTSGFSGIATGNQVTKEKHKKSTGSHGRTPMLMTSYSKGLGHSTYVLGYHGYFSDSHRMKEILFSFSFFEYPWVLNLF